MPRVHTRTRKRAEVKRAMRCAAHPCVVANHRLGDKLNDGASYAEIQNADEIKVGDTYYTWSRKSGRGGVTYFQHRECGYPKRSQLSNRKTVAIEDAIDSANDEIQSWTPELGADDTYSDGFEEITNALQTVADVAREVGQEYQDGFDNMPEGLNQGPTAQAMEEVAQELEGYADELESFEPSSTEPDLPDREDEQEKDEWREACQTAIDDWASDVRSEAEDKMSEMPEYQG